LGTDVGDTVVAEPPIGTSVCDTVHVGTGVCDNHDGTGITVTHDDTEVVDAHVDNEVPVTHVDPGDACSHVGTVVSGLYRVDVGSTHDDTVTVVPVAQEAASRCGVSTVALILASHALHV
jgi:hypothetical protein